LSFCGIALVSAQERKNERVPVWKQIVALDRKFNSLEVFSNEIDNKIEKLGLSLDEKIELLIKLQHDHKKQNENEIKLLKNALSKKQAVIDELKMNDEKMEEKSKRFQCKPLYTGENCNECINGYFGGYPNCKDECEDQPCQNGGTCIDEIGTYTCDCSGTGYMGTNCTTVVDECKGNIDPSTPCNDRGKCKNNNGDYTCECGNGFGGKHCENQLKFGIKEVSMTVSDYGGCGQRNKKAEIQIINTIQYKYNTSVNGASCTTYGTEYPSGKVIKWNSESLLKDCDEKNIFDPTSRNLGLKIIRQDPRKRYCITELKVKLNDPSSTTYKLTVDEDWRYHSGPDNNQNPYNLKRQ